MICATCRRELPVDAFVVRRRAGSRRFDDRRVPWCRQCRRAHRERADERPRGLGTNPRATSTNPRAIASNPRAIGTNPVAGKAERAGQWRAAFRRIDQLPPDAAHRVARALDADGETLPAAVVDELRRRLPQRRP